MFGVAAACAVFLLFALAGVSAAQDLTRSATPAPIVLKLTEVDEGFHFVDNPPVNGQHDLPTAGDVFTFNAKLLNPKGKRVGSLYVSCTLITGGVKAVSNCEGTFSLPGGDLIAAAMQRGDQLKTVVAVLGGTKAYRGMRGSIVSISQGKNSNRSSDTITLFR
jgi:hypothetical protein